MIKYQYQLVRYIHDQFTGEFGNIGVIVYAPDCKFLQCRMVGKYARLSNFFGEVNGPFLLNSLRHLEAGIRKIAQEMETDATGNVLDNLASLTRSLLPKDDSALQLGDIQYGLDLDLERAMLDLFERLVEKYNSDEKTQPHTDAYAWRKVYKAYFDKYDITRQLQKHSVNTGKDTIEFDRAWKNGVWNCYQPLSFDLKTSEAIKSKVYKWSGMIKALQTAQEELHIVLLTTQPQDHVDLKVFIDEMLTVKVGNVVVEIVEEQEAEVFAANVRNQMQSSHSFPEENDLPF